jgi:serine/threonine-protein kinase
LSGLGSLASILDDLAETPGPALAILPGTVIGGRFRVDGLIAAGGMGVVLRARDGKLGRDVAIKLHARQSAAATKRLVDEAAAQARVSHPNVVTAYEVGEIGAAVFIAMELVEGQTVRAWLAERSRTWREILGVYLGAGAGVAAVHRAGLVHRDLKPDNILVGTDGRVRVADFGLALAGDAGANAPRAGTPAYMAPEQRAGQAVDARADQYSFCAALAEALAATARAPGWLRAVVARGGATDPTRRYPDMDALLGALAPERRDRRRRRAWFGVALVAVATGAAGLAAALRAPSACVIAEEDAPWTAARAARVERAFRATGVSYGADAFARVDTALARYAAAWRTQRAAVCKDSAADVAARRLACADERAGAARALADVLAEADRTTVEHSAAAVESLPELGRCADTAYLLARVKPPERGTAEAVAQLRAEVDAVTAQYLAGHYQDALVHGLPLVGPAAATSYVPVQAEVHLALGTVQNYAGLAAQSAASLERAYFTALRVGDDEVAARSATELVDVYGFELIRFADAEQWARHAEAEVARAAGGTDMEAEYLTRLALLREQQSAYREALAGYQRALALRGRLGPGQEVVSARLQTSIAAVLDSLGRPRDALAAYRAALDLRAGVLPTLHPDNVNTLDLLAYAHWEVGEPEAGLVIAEAALTVGQLTLGRLHPKVGLGRVVRGRILRELGALAAAADDEEEALAIFRATRGPAHPNVATALGELALTEARLGRGADALAHARDSLAIYARTLGVDDPHLAIAATRLGVVLAAVRGCAEALPVLRGAVTTLDRVNRDGEGTGAALVELASCQAATGAWDEAAATARRAAALGDERGAPRAHAAAARALLARAAARESAR